MSRFMTPIHTIVVNGTDLSSYCGLYTSGEGTFDSAEKDYELITVPGRTGDLIRFNKRTKNGTVSYPSFIVDDFEANMIKLRNFLYSLPVDYVRIVDTRHNDEYRMGIHTGTLNPTVLGYLEAATFDLQFNVMPQRFLKSGEAPVTYSSGSHSINNPTNYDASPLMRVAMGSAKKSTTIKVNGVAISISGLPSNGMTLLLDFEKQNAVNASTGASLNPYTIVDNHEYPKLKPGANTITTDSSATVYLTPRWYRL